MITLLKGGAVYAPEFIGQKDILLCGGEIVAISDSIDVGSLEVYVLDCSNKIITSGLIDGHVHLIGGGGEKGFTSRVPEAKISEIVRGGVTSVVGMLGTDSLTRSLESLLAKVKSLNALGISAYMLTGAYRFPSPSILGDVSKDVAFIQEILGTKIAVSDFRSSHLSGEELARLLSETFIGGLVGAKAGVTVMHLGNSKTPLDLIRRALELSEIPMDKVLPTHCGRNRELFAEALDFASRGGNIDLTACQSTPQGDTVISQVFEALDKGIELERISISSDNYGSQPVFNDKNELVSFSYSNRPVLLECLKDLLEQGLELSKAIRFFTTNVASRLGLEGSKGRVEVGYDADLLVLDNDMNLERVFARGVEVVVHDQCLIEDINSSYERRED